MMPATYPSRGTSEPVTKRRSRFGPAPDGQAVSVMIPPLHRTERRRTGCMRAGHLSALSGVLPAGRAAEAMHVGPYDTLSQTYDEVMRWVQEHGMHPGTDMWEYYLSDPSTEPDPASWRTRVLWSMT